MTTLSLDEIGVLEGTDKSSGVNLGWDYLRHYEAWFSTWRDREINVIEIGVASGASLMTMLAFFTRATIVGIDIEPSCAALARERAVIEIGSQDDPEFLDRVLTRFPPTIVVDDGSHRAHHMIFSFETIFPRLEPGGLYIVEDLAFHFGDEARNMGEPAEGSSAADYFLALAKSILSRRSTPRPVLQGPNEGLVEMVEFVDFIDGAIAIGKKANLARGFNIAQAIERARARGIPLGDAVGRYCEYGLRAGIPMHEVEAAFDGVSPDERTIPYYLAYTGVLRGADRLENAIQIAEEGARRFGHDALMPWRHGYYLCEAGKLEEGLVSLTHAASLYPEYCLEIVDTITRFCDWAGQSDKGKEVLRGLANHATEPRWRDAISQRLV